MPGRAALPAMAALIWITPAADLRPAALILQLFSMAALSNRLSHRIVRSCKLFEGGTGDQTMVNP